ncbi:hypothetical protein ACFYY5_01360 [Nocardia elegans]|uniref:Terminase small subunit n=1 Tax=Nocardia elegans TaxID=300029 RepID=A0ABW6T5Q1_9NOCA
MSIPKHPAGLGPAGKRLWTTVLTDYWMDGEPHKLAILEHACKVSDRIEELESAAEGEPLTVLGSARQLTIHPLIGEVRAQRGLLTTLLKSLQLPEGEETDEEMDASQKRIARAKKAAAARWGNR